jgi:hypothetical protein
MKNKSLLLTAFAIIGLTVATMAQNNCNLINSVTINASGEKTLGAITYGGPNGVFSTWINCPLLTQKWNYVAYTKDLNNNYSFYINGNLVKTGQYQNLPYSWGSLRLGTDIPSNPNSFFNGKIDELKISNIVRSISDINTYYSQNLPFVADANTIGLYDFNQANGLVINAISGPNGTGYNTMFSSGVYNNSISFNGINSYANFPLDVPEQNLTVEFWVFINNIQGTDDWIINYPGIYGAGFQCLNYTPYYSWSTGATGDSINVNPSALPYVWVSDGNCTDTVWFDSKNIRNVSVTDTLLINITVSNINPPNNKNIIKVYPNPTNNQITIDNGDLSKMNGYSIKIINSIGQQLYQGLITQQQNTIDITQWGGTGIYYLQVIDSNGNIIEIKKIILQ